ncbi:uncharacterized protein LOC143917007 [Arctopsyche grandis]|uniref:uncharacterized protein LOC143917007 n=1 Tax=Arctopsyche grandis TaxID=121162 RepID=UPI00406DA1AB
MVNQSSNAEPVYEWCAVVDEARAVISCPPNRSIETTTSDGKREKMLAAIVLLFIAANVASADENDVGNLAISFEDVPDYEVLNFPSNSEATLRSTNQTQQVNGPCTCKTGQCTCCTGPILDLIQQKACMKIVYAPEDFAFDFSMLLNNRVMYQNKVSGKNPPPACISIPRLDSLRLCAKFSNVYFAGRNLHVCMGMNGRWNSYELFAFSFDCLRMGADGFFFLKPEAGGFPEGVNGGIDAVIDSGDDIEDYDENVVRSVIKDLNESLGT